MRDLNLTKCLQFIGLSPEFSLERVKIEPFPDGAVS